VLHVIGKQNYQEPGVGAVLNFEFFGFLDVSPLRQFASGRFGVHGVMLNYARNACDVCGWVLSSVWRIVTYHALVRYLQRVPCCQLS